MNSKCYKIETTRIKLDGRVSHEVIAYGETERDALKKLVDLMYQFQEDTYEVTRFDVDKTTPYTVFASSNATHVVREIPLD